MGTRLLAISLGLRVEYFSSDFNTQNHPKNKMAEVEQQNVIKQTETEEVTEKRESPRKAKKVAEETEKVTEEVEKVEAESTEKVEETNGKEEAATNGDAESDEESDEKEEETKEAEEKTDGAPVAVVSPQKRVAEVEDPEDESPLKKPKMNEEEPVTAEEAAA